MKVTCIHCGDSVERQNNRKDVSCFECKRKRLKMNAIKYKHRNKVQTKGANRHLAKLDILE